MVVQDLPFCVSACCMLGKASAFFSWRALNSTLYIFRAVETAWLAKPYQHTRLFRHRLFTMMFEKSRHLCYSNPGQRTCSCTSLMSCPFNCLAEKCTKSRLVLQSHLACEAACGAGWLISD